MTRTKEMQEFVDGLANEFFGRTQEESLEKNICVMCGNVVENFRDSLSLKEYSISGMCQQCQDKIFGK